MLKIRPNNSDGNNLEVELQMGILVGMVSRSQSFLIMTTEHVYIVRNVQNMAAGYGYDPTSLEWALLKIKDYAQKRWRAHSRRRRGLRHACPTLMDKDRWTRPAVPGCMPMTTKSMVTPLDAQVVCG